MNRFRVWLNPLGSSCKVRVDGIKNTRWLLTRLSQYFVFKTSQPIHDDEAASCSTFYLQYNSQTPYAGFQKALAAIREVELMPEPAA